MSATHATSMEPRATRRGAPPVLRAVPATLTLREMLRVSHDDSGRERSQDEQHGDHVRSVEHDPRFTLSDLPAYRSTGSASRYRQGRKRKDFPALMADLESGAFGADGLLMWENSRTSRRADEWLDLLRVMERAEKVLVVWRDGMRVYDPANHTDWHHLMREAIDAERESRITSQRVRRAMEANARDGAPQGGRRAYGYSKDGRTTVDEEVALIHEAARRVLAGESVRAIAKDWNERGVVSASGKAWHPGPLRSMLTGNRIAGIRTHHGDVVARGAWPAIIDGATHRRLVATLAARGRTGERGRTPWLLTGLLRCGWCGAVLVGNTDASSRGEAPRRRYVCRKAPGYNGCGRLTIKAEPVEELLGRIVVERLQDVDARRGAVPMEDDSGEQEELDAIAARRVEVAESYAEDGDKASKDASMAALRRREQEVEARLAAKHRDGPSPLAFVVEEGLVGKAWGDLLLPQQQRVLRALIEHVAVGPATTRGSTRFEASRITDGITWRA